MKRPANLNGRYQQIFNHPDCSNVKLAFLHAVQLMSKNVRNGLVRYCEHGMPSIDNNLSERMVRAVAIGRKNWMFLGSDNGGKAAAILYSVMASAKANQVEPFAYVRDLLVRLLGSQPDNPSNLLPDEWVKTNPDARRRWSR